MSDNGSIVIRVADGTMKGDDSPPKNCFVELTFPSGLVSSSTCKSDDADNFAFRMNKDLSLKQRIAGHMKLIVKVVQHNKLLANQVLGSSELALDPLTRGEKMENVQVAINAKITVTMSVDWKGSGISGDGSGGGAGGALGLASPTAAAAGGGGYRGSSSSSSSQGGKGKAAALPDPTAQSYSVRVKVHRIKNLQSTDPEKLYDPCVVVSASNKTMRTDVQKNTNEPIFDEECAFTFESAKANFWNEMLVVDVVNHRSLLPDQKIGVMVFDFASIYGQPSHSFLRRWFVLIKKVGDGTVMGYIKASISITNLRTDPVIELDLDGQAEGDDDEDDDDIIAKLVATPGCIFESIHLHSYVARVADLCKMDSGPTGTCDPYVKIIFGTQTSQSDFKENCQSAVFNQWLVTPMMLPSMTSAIKVQVFDRDMTSPDDMACSLILDIREISRGASSTPHLFPRYFNFIGHPRSCDADYNKYFEKMNLCLLPGIDYRGRALLGFTGVKTRNEIPRPLIYETSLTVQVDCELLQVSHLPGSSDCKFKVFLGKAHKKTEKTYEPKRMIGESGGSASYSFYCGEKVQFSTSIPVVLPQEESDETAYFASCLERSDRLQQLVWQQIPPLVIQQVSASKMNAALSMVENLAGAQDEDPLASIVIPATEFYEEEREVGSQKYTGLFRSATMSCMKDPSSISSGDAPVAPLLQYNATLTITSASGASVQQEVQQKALGTQVRKSSPFHSRKVPSEKYGGEKFLAVYLYHGKSFPSGDSNGLSDPYLQIAWGNAVTRSGMKSDSLNPAYNEALYLFATCHQPESDIILEIWDHDSFQFSNTFLGKILLDPHKIPQGELVWLKDFRDAQNRLLPDVQLLVRIEFAEATDDIKRFIHSAPKRPMQIASDSKKTYLGYPIPTKKQLQTAEYNLNLKVLALRNMRKFRLRAISTPKVVFEVQGHKMETSTADSLGMFSEEVSWKLTLPYSETMAVLPNISVLVFDRRLGSDTLVGSTCLALDDEWLNLERKKETEKKSSAACAAKLNTILKLHKVLCSEEAELARDAETQELLQEAAFTPSEINLARSESGTVLSSSAAAAGGNNNNNNNNNNNKNAPNASSAATAAAGGGGGGGGDTMDQSLLQNEEREGDETPPDINHGAYDGSATPRGKSATELARRAAAHDATAIDRKLKAAYQKMEDAQNSESDAASDASSEPDEALWYDRFDPASIDSGSGSSELQAHRRVARFGRLGRVKGGGAFRNGHTTTEDVFGPFSDGMRTLPLHRGWNAKNRVKAGSLILDASIKMLNVNETMSAAQSLAALKEAAAAKKKLQQKEGGSGSGGTGDSSEDLTFKKMSTRARKPFLARVYVLEAKDLTAMDSGIFGKSSDPYVIMKLSAGNAPGTSSSEDVVVNCKDQIRYQVCDPEFFFMRELSGELPKHSNLRITVLDWDRFAVHDDVIGFTDINLEERYYSCRGYSRPRLDLDPSLQLERQNPAAFYGLHHYGSYTEKRLLRNESGMSAGSIELWVDLFDFSITVPRPIDIAPPPPVPMELRVTVWAARDVELVDESISGERMTDIYAKVWIDGMQNQQQNTDVHYRSLDGSGAFNWRMNFQLAFDPRLKKVFTLTDAMKSIVQEESASGGGGEEGESKKKKEATSTATSSFFSVRKEAKRVKPRLHVQFHDNDLLPFTDDFIGEGVLDLTALLPVFGHRQEQSLARTLTDDCRSCYNHKCCVCNKVCTCGFCEKRPDIIELSLEERQEVARQERKEERERRMKSIDKEVDAKLQNLKGSFSAAELPRVREKLVRAAKKASKVNVFKDFMPQRRKKSQKEQDDLKHNEEMQKRLKTFGGSAAAAGGGGVGNGEGDLGAIAMKPDESKKNPAVSEHGRCWYSTHSPQGGYRTGDVQISFELVPLTAIAKDESLRAGKGRSAPQQLPEPDRPDSSFFWLSSPFKSAIHIFWKNYKQYIFAIICIALAVWLLVSFITSGVDTKAAIFFG